MNKKYWCSIYQILNHELCLSTRPKKKIKKLREKMQKIFTYTFLLWHRRNSNPGTLLRVIALVRKPSWEKNVVGNPSSYSNSQPWVLAIKDLYHLICIMYMNEITYYTKASLAIRNKRSLSYSSLLDWNWAFLYVSSLF
jgi:hypothetical protein